MNYKIEQRIYTLAENAVMSKSPASFVVSDIEFSHSNFDYANGWQGDYWLSKTEVKADNYLVAFNLFNKSLAKIIPRISLISQCYIEYLYEPFIISKANSDIALFSLKRDSGSCGLMFMEDQKDALDILLLNNSIPDEFYYYWNDATNAYGYSAKLLLMFSAIEALVKKADGSKDFVLLEKLLGKHLKEVIWGTVGNSQNGLRHRLIHGEYFDKQDHGTNYLEMMHGKIVSWFNNELFNKELISENVTHPQRHPFGNKERGDFFVKKLNHQTKFSLPNILGALSKDGVKFENGEFEIFFQKDFEKTF